jgi:hypothetical protein
MQLVAFAPLAAWLPPSSYRTSLIAGVIDPNTVFVSRVPVLTMLEVNGGVLGEPETVVRIWAAPPVRTKFNFRAGLASAGLVGAGVNVNVPVQSEFTV